MKNIQGMLEEIRNVVQNHFEHENNNISATLSVLNNLPLVISLRKEVEELKQKNRDLLESLKKYEDMENIELEIVELEKNSSLDKKLVTDFFGKTEVSEDEDPEDSMSEDSDEEVIINPYELPLSSDMMDAGIVNSEGAPQDDVETKNPDQPIQDVSGVNTNEA